MTRKPEPSDQYGGPAPEPYVKRGEVWRDEPEPLPEGHPVREAWVAKIAAASTPVREFELVDGVRHFRSWIRKDGVA